MGGIDATAGFVERGCELRIPSNSTFAVKRSSSTASCPVAVAGAGAVTRADWRGGRRVAVNQDDPGRGDLGAER